MKRLALILAAVALLAVGPTAKAGELDAEYGAKLTNPAAKPALAVGKPSGELDSESPDQACCWRKRFFGYGCFRPYGYGFGYGGFGYGGFGYGGIGYASYASYGYGGYGGFGGLGFGGYW